MNSIAQVLKLIVLSIVGLVALTYFTVDAPKKIEKKAIKLSDLPKTVELLGYDDSKFTTNSIIKKGTIIFVGNHESIVLANKLESMLNLKKGEFVIVSNISDAPWFIKRWQAYEKNITLKGEKHLPWIYDKNGAMRNFLQVPTSDSVKYFVYKVRDNENIEKIYNGKVKFGTLDGAMSDKEQEENLQKVIDILKSVSK
ncbi:MAG: hypothetical protein U9O56_01275 [Campylobacterota bacterium]|nr:hypothetical protein [Campylobacterota bacterium]